MSTTENQNFFVIVSEARAPVAMTAVQSSDTLERGRSPVPITPIQTHAPAPTPVAPAPAPLKK